MTTLNPYRVRQVADRDPRYFPLLFVAFLALAAMYVVWRTAVVNWGVWYGPVAWLAEIFGLTTAIMFVVTLRRSARPVPRAAGAPRSVDVLIPTANEPLSVLEPTVIGATRLRGVRRVFVLDDGDRAEVREMARRLGTEYLARAGNEGAKAGNLNHGLTATDAEFIVTLDADHVPLPGFIEQTLGYFDDPRVGFVQSPQSFYNTESFTFRHRRGRAAGWHEQGMFYGGIQPTKNSTNSAIYTGTSAMLRRSAIDSVGGFAPDTPTEDIHTSLRLHARGWRSVYLRMPLAYGLEVENLEEYYRTRRRWAAGSLRLLFRHPDSPLRVRGLSAFQRLNYLSAMVTHLQGPNRVLYLVAPIAALITGVPPVHGPYAWYGFAFLLFTVLSIWTVVVFGRGHYHLVHSEAFGIADTLPMITALGSLFYPDRSFGVSRKRTGRTGGGRLKAAYQLFAAVNLAGLGLAVVRLVRGEHVVIAGWSAAFLALGTAYVLVFLVSLHRYERRAGAPSYIRFTPEQLYHHVVALSTDSAAVRSVRAAEPEPVPTL
ncbi:glycosyltransferase [Micromonospora sp. KC723]|uniref:glycosyltransferase family 2 protein n=1 Tax=Micromonospora sp. KC723 TaxID=2530381 RepID=UPI00104640AB|nr:cellulose synthase catalytic subunit [Micromonospora sp. KC723]TDB78473.1 glycosyltransferase [Micromonospora sp. KC723]